MERNKKAAECFFLDVGQGTSQVLLLKDGSAIVIDGGPGGAKRTKRNIPLILLERYLSKDIEALVISHNDGDHINGALRIFTSYSNRIKRIYFLHDNSNNCNKISHLIKTEEINGHFSGEVLRLEASQKPHLLFEDNSQRIMLELLSPTFQDVLEANNNSAYKYPHRVCGILILHCGSRRILFSGDANVEAFESLYNQKRVTINCDIIAVPHHGGINHLNKTCDEINQKQRWLYQEALKSKYAIISVGSKNHYKHPQKEVIDALNYSGIKVICTEITPKCCNNIDSLKPGLIDPQIPSLSNEKKDSHIACFGTVLVEIAPDVIEITRFGEHQKAIDTNISLNLLHPLCRS